MWLNREIFIKKSGVKEYQNILMDASEFELKNHPYFTYKQEMIVKITNQIIDKHAILRSLLFMLP